MITAGPTQTGPVSMATQIIVVSINFKKYISNDSIGNIQNPTGNLTTALNATLTMGRNPRKIT
jgi:hypothetical protein